MKNKPSPAEQLIASIDMNLGFNEFQQIYSRKDAQQLSHVMAMSEIWESIKESKKYAEYINGENVQDAIDVYNFLHKQRVFEKSNKQWSFSDIWHKLQKDMNPKKNTSAQSDLNADMTNFVDMFIGEWNSLSKTAKAFATIEMLSGFDADVNILKLPPIKLMDKGILKIFLPAFERNIRSLTYSKIEEKKQSAKKTRVQAAYLREQLKMHKEQQENEKFMKVCSI